MLIQRHDVESTLIQYYFNFMCPEVSLQIQSVKANMASSERTYWSGKGTMTEITNFTEEVSVESHAPLWQKYTNEYGSAIKKINERNKTGYHPGYIHT